MNEISEETKREVLKLAVHLTTTYVIHPGEFLTNRDQYWFGLEKEQAGDRLPALIETIYRQLLGIMDR
ncbi:TPA: hypothetical protein ACU6GO_005768 [Pseudomonas aeruginosa]|uniref:hypothetical protein n=1 Tax=Pseudomonas aeruginosa TaxID=287 RepID=UPI000FC41F5E|nr:hypothetical protein [Pseudomonas aeruginosa]RUI12047.1 hypothetical protein IPC443_32365 [Pseudomonas aeruginosa]HBO4520301.1 hypothetical protein [Pseudomonas aeruginosa]HBO6310301.1 hypothetical protein [Pseudomonas aeruginosa]